MIKNLVFDFGGVFSKIELQRCIDAFEALGFKNVSEYMNLYYQKGFFGDMESGKITDEDFRRGVSEHAGREVSWEECQKAWLSFIAEVPKSNLEYVQKFKAEGYNVALLSNTNPYVTSWFRSDKFDGKGHGIDYYIPREHQYLSFDQKCMKPGKEIFEKMLHDEGFIPEETLFVDDGEGNLKTASELGIKTFLPTNGEHWGKRLEEYLEEQK